MTACATGWGGGNPALHPHGTGRARTPPTRLACWFVVRVDFRPRNSAEGIIRPPEADGDIFAKLSRIWPVIRMVFGEGSMPN